MLIAEIMMKIITITIAGMITDASNDGNNGTEKYGC